MVGKSKIDALNVTSKTELKKAIKKHITTPNILSKTNYYENNYWKKYNYNTQTISLELNIKQCN